MAPNDRDNLQERDRHLPPKSIDEIVGYVKSRSSEVIVIDTSALISILDQEPERMIFYEVIARADRRLVSAVAHQEAGHVLIARRGVNGLYDLEELLALIEAEVIPHDRQLAAFALEAFRRYGKGIVPRACLNFCDCAIYALAKSMDAPLLFKGRDFASTDVKSWR